MSKKINTKAIDATATTSEEATTATPTTPVADLRSLMEQYPNASLRKLAISCEISYGWVLKCSKKPIPNVPYDPEAINYEEVAQVFARRGIDLNLVDWAALNEGTLRKGALLTKDMDAFQVGAKVWLREDNVTPFTICYKTETHIVIMKDGTTEPRAWSHATFLMKGPVFEPRTITEKSNDSVEEATEEA
jgi:hypothetical protein